MASKLFVHSLLLVSESIPNMATAQDVIDRATSLLRVRSAGVSFVTDDSSMNGEIFAILQNLIAEWAESGTLSIPAPSAATDTLDVSDGTIRGLAYGLAIDAASAFGRSVTPEVVMVASETKDQLEANNAIEISITHDPFLTRSSRYNVKSDR